MDKKSKIKEIIVVEGHSDTAKLKNLIECDTIETSGSAIDEKTLLPTQIIPVCKSDKKLPIVFLIVNTLL